MRKILIGNTFPMALVARKLRIFPVNRFELTSEAAGKAVFSFWGHEETLKEVNCFLGLDLTPREPRPALTLNGAGYPLLYGNAFKECWIVTPVQEPGKRPHENKKKGAQSYPIWTWRVLQIKWV